MGYPAEFMGGGKVELPDPRHCLNPCDDSHFTDDGIAFAYSNREWDEAWARDKIEEGGFANYWLRNRINPAREALSQCRDKIEAKAALLACGFRVRTYRGGEALDIMEAFYLSVSPRMNLERTLQIGIFEDTGYHQGRMGYYISLPPFF